jgi:hypothetical protein
MSALRLARALLALLALAVLAGGAHAAATVTFTPDDKGTFPKTLRYDAKEKLLTVDLSGLPKDAGVFRAELVLAEADRFAQVPVEPTTVYPDGQPEKKLKLVGPRFHGLDAREAVEAAIKAGQPLKLRLQVTLAGASRLEVSCLGARPRAADIPKAGALNATHRKGQSLLTFAEPKLEVFPEFKTGADVTKFRDEFLKNHPATTLRIWRGPERISPKAIAKATLVGECGFLSAWNSAYHQDETGKQPPVRYRVTDLGEPLPWGTGVYAHNPAEAGKAYYAVTVAVGGEEDLDALDAGATTAGPVEETVGPGEPVLQWEEHPKDWQYRQGPLTRLVYTRWESWPNASVPNTPIDYLVAMGDDPPPAVLPREAENHAWRVEPAPVGLHLHCWGGSLNGGYGWWYNAHRGAVLIASNQVPYDWWTGYHERLRTAKTFGDGHVQPFTMTRTFAFLDWAGRQWQEAPEAVRKHWRKLDPTRVFTAGSSMGGAGAPMYPIRFPDRIAWCIAWVGVHVPAESPGFHESYQNVYGPRDAAITMPDGKTSPWDWFSDVAWMRKNPKAETGFIIASNGKDDGGIGWKQAYEFARTLQETRRPHLYNWGMSGHGTRTVVGANFDIDVRTDQSLPAFTNGTLDGALGTGKLKTKEEMEAEKARQEDEARKAGKDPKQVRVCPTDGDPEGAYNAHLAWETGDLTDTPEAWEMTVVLKASAPKDSCNVDLTPRRLQKFRTPQGAKFAWLVIDAQTATIVAEGTVVADACDLVTLKQIPLAKGKNRVRIVPSK